MFRSILNVTRSPGKIVHGFLPPAQIPSSISAEKKLENLKSRGNLNLTGCVKFLLEQRRGTDIIRVGSCLGASISLGSVGDLDLRWAFDITISDFTRDPLFKGPGDASGFSNFGLIEFVLRDKKIGRGLASI
jgi:hypothetical protein